jgi:hypothetical protein
MGRTGRIPGQRSREGALNPSAARALAARLLAAAGYALAGRAERSDSLYFESPDRPGRIRVSDHRTSPGRRGSLPGPTVSVVIDRCLSRRQIEARISGAIRDHAGACGAIASRGDRSG